MGRSGPLKGDEETEFGEGDEGRRAKVATKDGRRKGTERWISTVRGRASKEERAPEVAPYGVGCQLKVVTRVRRVEQASSFPNISGNQSWVAIESRYT